MTERVDGEGGAYRQRHFAALAQRAKNGVVAGGRRHDGDRCEVLGRGPDHRRPADVDLFDQLGEADARPFGGDCERVEIDHNELERGDRRSRQLGAMRRLGAVGEDAGVDARMERLDPTVKHLARAGQAATSVTSRPAPRRAAAVPRSKRSHSRARTGLSRTRPGPLCPTPTTAPAWPATWHRPGQLIQPAGSLAPVAGVRLNGCARAARPVVAGQDCDRLLQQDLAAVKSVVDEVDRYAGRLDAGAECVVDSAGAWERGQQRRMHVDHAPGEGGQRLWPDDPHEAGQDDDVGRDAGQGSAKAPVEFGRIGISDQGGRQVMLGGPVERRAWSVRDDENELDRQAAGARRLDE